MTNLFTFVVEDRPAPQGSKRSYGKGRMVEMSKYLKPWRNAVTAAAIERRSEAGADGCLFEQGVPLALRVTFWHKRPKSHYGTGRNSTRLRDDAPTYVTTTPDLSKLIRSTEDAITASGVWHDDNQVVHHDPWQKYSDTGFEGAEIEIRVVTE